MGRGLYLRRRREKGGEKRKVPPELKEKKKNAEYRRCRTFTMVTKQGGREGKRGTWKTRPLPRNKGKREKRKNAAVQPHPVEGEGAGRNDQ